MFGESNDWFFAPGPNGIALYDANGNAIAGDVTSQVSLWNAGTEIDQEPGVGDSTGPHQSAPDFGAADPDPTVREIPLTSLLSDGTSFTRPEIAEMIRVTLTPGQNRQFTLRIENVSTATTLVTSQGARSIHVSPVTWALHGAPAPLFQVGQADRGQGLELIPNRVAVRCLPPSSMHCRGGRRRSLPASTPFTRTPSRCTRWVSSIELEGSKRSPRTVTTARSSTR
jgi:hypothetical protein